MAASSTRSARKARALTDHIDESNASLAIKLFVRIVAVVLIAIVVLGLVRGNTGVVSVFKPIVSEARYHRAKFFDHLLFVVSILLAMAVCLLPRLRLLESKWVRWGFGAIATAGLSLGVFAVEEPNLVVTMERWGGFGPAEFLAVLLFLPVAWILFEWRSLPTWSRNILTAAMAVTSLADLASVYRPSFMVGTWSLNDSYIVNDVLAQSAGKVPDHSYIPQYEAILGWVLKPFASSISAGAMSAACAQVMAVITLAGIVCAVLIVHRVLGRRSFALALFFVVPLVVVSVANHPLSNTLGAYQELPIRIAPPIVVAFFTLEDLVRLRASRPRRWPLLAEGFAAAVLAWSNQDFCLGALLALGLLFILSASPRRGGLRQIAPWISGLLAGLVVYPLALFLAGTPIQVHFLLFFQTVFGKGYLNFPIQLPGPALFALPVCLGAAGAGVWAVWTRPQPADLEQVQMTEARDRAALTAAFFGVYTTVALTYYVAQSVATGPLEALMMPIGVALAALVALAMSDHCDYRAGARRVIDSLPRGAGLSVLLAAIGAASTYLVSGAITGAIAGGGVGWLIGATVWRSWSNGHRRSRAGVDVLQPWRSWLSILPLTVAASLPMAALVQTPNPVLAVKELVHPPHGTSVVWPPLRGIEQARDLARSRERSLSYFGAFGNYVQLATHVPSVAIVNVPPATPKDYTPTSPDCRYIAGHPSAWLLVDVGTANLYGQEVCRMYTRTSIRFEGPYFVYALMQHRSDAQGQNS